MKEVTLKYNFIEIVNIKYNYFINGRLEKIYASFPDGNTLANPYAIALALFELPMDFLNKNEKLLNKVKIVQFFKNDIPYNEMLFVLTGGDATWKSIEWDYEKNLRFWKADIDDLLKDAFTLYDLILIFRYFKYEHVLRNFNEFLRQF